MVHALPSSINCTDVEPGRRAHAEAVRAAAVAFVKKLVA
jgi:hypothetical protein